MSKGPMMTRVDELSSGPKLTSTRENSSRSVLRRLFSPTEEERELQTQKKALKKWIREVPTLRRDCALHFAAQFHHLALLESLVQERSPGPWLDQRNSEGKTPLQIAVLAGDEKIVAALLHLGNEADFPSFSEVLNEAVSRHRPSLILSLVRGAPRNFRSLLPLKAQRTCPLSLSVQKKAFECTEVLLEVDLEQRRNPAGAPRAWFDDEIIMESAYAIMKHNTAQADLKSHFPKLLELLVELGTYIPGLMNGSTQLCKAVRSNDVGVAGQVLRYGANPNTESGSGVPPLLIAADSDYTGRMVELLVQHGAKIDARSTFWGNALRGVIRNNNLDGLRALIKSGGGDFHKNFYIHGSSALFFAVERSRGQMLRIFLDSPLSPRDFTNAAGETPLIAATRNLDLGMVKLLIEFHASLETKDRSGASALHWAMERGNENMIKLLVEAGASVTSHNGNGQSALELAVTKGLWGPFRALWAAKSSKPAAYSSRQLLLLARKSKSWQITTELLEKCSNIDEPLEADGETLLYTAIGRKDREFTKYLLDRGADPNKTLASGDIPLLTAIHSGMSDIALKLVEAGADPNKTLASGDSPLLTAIRSGMSDIALKLVEAGADPNHSTGGESAADVLARSGIKGSVGLFEALVTRGARLPTTFERNHSPLPYLIHEGTTSIVKTYLEHGIDPNGAEFGITHLMTAIALSKVEVAMALLEHGADPLVTSPVGTIHYVTALSLCLPKVCWPGIVRLLEQMFLKGVDPDTPIDNRASAFKSLDVETAIERDPRGVRKRLKHESLTPLMFCAVVGWTEAVELLLRYGASVDIVDIDGLTVRDMITENNTPCKTQVMDILSTNGAGHGSGSSARSRLTSGSNPFTNLGVRSRPVNPSGLNTTSSARSWPADRSSLHTNLGSSSSAPRYVSFSSTPSARNTYSVGPFTAGMLEGDRSAMRAAVGIDEETLLMLGLD